MAHQAPHNPIQHLAVKTCFMKFLIIVDCFLCFFKYAFDFHSKDIDVTVIGV